MEVSSTRERKPKYKYGQEAKTIGIVAQADNIKRQIEIFLKTRKPFSWEIAATVPQPGLPSCILIIIYEE